MNKFHFVPECWAETMMVRIILLASGHKKDDDFYNHAGGSGDVSRILKKNDIKGFLNIGFVDDDRKGVPLFFGEFHLLDKHPVVDFKKHPKSNDYLIVVKPAMEKFLLSQLREIGKQPSDYSLPDDFGKFKLVLKNIKLEHDPNYKAMISDLLQAPTSGIAFILQKVASLR